MAANTSAARLPHPWTSDGLSRYCPFAEFSSVAGVDAPAFVERTRRSAPCSAGSCVAGVDAPAFVERPRSATSASRRPRVSPELTLRPSLSDGLRRDAHGRVPGVAGVDAPAFVERSHRGFDPSNVLVSPELTLRPSLSVVADDLNPAAPHLVSPELTLRPSLSDSPYTLLSYRDLKCRRS